MAFFFQRNGKKRERKTMTRKQEKEEKFKRDNDKKMKRDSAYTFCS